MLKKKKKDFKLFVILKTTVKGLGQVGDVVGVKPGYARNCLNSHGLAIPATKENIIAFEKQKVDIEKKREEELIAAKSQAEKIEAVGILALKQHASEDGKLFGSVTHTDIAKLMKDSGLEISYRDISLKSAIKYVGEYVVTVTLHPKVVSEITLRVEKK